MLGVNSPFFVGCHSAARSGRTAARLLLKQTRCPAQKGHPRPPRVRRETGACHSWSLAAGQSHQTARPVPAVTPDGISRPFLVGCHCPATSGNRTARLLLTDTRCPAQKGQPVPRRVRDSGIASHSWSPATSHFHHTFLRDDFLTLKGVTVPFLVGCHCSATSGNKSANDSPGFGTADGTPPVSPTAVSVIYRWAPWGGSATCEGARWPVIWPLRRWWLLL